MGCTSSAPNTTPSDARSEDNQDITDIKYTLSENENITQSKHLEIKEEQRRIKQDDAVEEVAAPECYTVDETLVSNTSIEEAPSLESQHQENFREDKHNVEDQHLSDIDVPTEAESDLDKPADICELEEPESPKAIEPDKKLSTLEDVVDKVVEIYITDKLDSLVIKQKDSSTTDEEKQPVNSKMNMDAAPDCTVDEERAPSPTQSSSSSSRATRWEALADMAAELPPSLTVDPVTGQIYALSK